MNVDPKELEKLIVEAHARVTWGDSREEVEAWMLDQGVQRELINEVVAASFLERDRDVRKKGAAELATGLLIAAAFAGGLYLMFETGIGSGRILAVLLGGALYGGYRAINGFVWLAQGKHIRGSVGEIGKDGF